MSFIKSNKSNKSIKTNNSSNQSFNYSLQNKDNYKPTINSSITEIMDKYSKLVFEYLLFITENIVTKNEKYNKFIIFRGLGTITHVFIRLLYYTNNLDISYYHSQKSFYFYVEFIGQISEDQHSFLQLSSRDASIFVYKKTIFEMPTDLNESFKNPKLFIMLDGYKLIIQTLIHKIVNDIDFSISNEDKKIVLIKNIENIEKINEKIMNQNTNIGHLNNIYYLIEQLDKCEIESSKYYNILDNLIKKYTKQKNNCNINKNITEKIIDPDFYELLNQNQDNMNKFIEIMLK